MKRAIVHFSISNLTILMYRVTEGVQRARNISNYGDLSVVYESRGGTSDFRLPTSDFRLPTSDFRLPTSDFRLPTSDFRLPTSDFRLPTSDFRLPTSDFRLQTSKSLLGFRSCVILKVLRLCLKDVMSCSRSSRYCKVFQTSSFLLIKKPILLYFKYMVIPLS